MPAGSAINNVKARNGYRAIAISIAEINYLPNMLKRGIKCVFLYTTINVITKIHTSPMVVSHAAAIYEYTGIKIPYKIKLITATNP